MTGAYWLEAKSGEYRCFYLSRPSDSHNCGDGDPKTVRLLYSNLMNFTDLYTKCVSDAWQQPYGANNKMDTGVYTKLTNTYGFDLKVRFQDVRQLREVLVMLTLL